MVTPDEVLVWRNIFPADDYLDLYAEGMPLSNFGYWIASQAQALELRFAGSEGTL